MTIEQDFLPYAVGGSANVLSQAAYAALTTLLQNGLTSGIVPSNELNKIMRQPSIIASVIGQFIVANSGQPAIDDGTTATLLANFTNAVNAASKTKVVLTDTGTANAYTAANPVPLTVLPTATGFTQTVKIAHLNTGTSTYAPDGLATAPIYSLAGALLQGNELPVNGVATLVSFVDPLLNSGSLCWVLYECVGGAQPVAPATASQHAVQFGQVAGVVGSVRNLRASLATAGTSLTITADEVVVESALGGLRYCVPNLNASVSTTVTGALGGVVGTALTADGYAGVYVGIAATGTAGLFINTAGTTTLLPNVAASPPANVIASALVSVWPLNGSTQFAPTFQVDRDIAITNAQVATTTAVVGSFTAVSISNVVPANARAVSGLLTASGVSVQNVFVSASGVPSGFNFKECLISAPSVATPGSASTTPFNDLMLSVAQTLYWAAGDTAATSISCSIALNGYKI